MAQKGIDGCLLHYGIRQDDMALVEQACADAGINFNWFRESILRPYNVEKINGTISDKKVKTILRRATKHYSDINLKCSDEINISEFNWDDEEEKWHKLMFD